MQVERTEETPSFNEVEKGFYDLVYKDYVEGQNARNVAARHKERNRTMDDLRESNLMSMLIRNIHIF